MPDWRPRQMRQDPRFQRQELPAYRRQKLMQQWARGASYREIAITHGTSVEVVRRTIASALKSLWNAKSKWKRAEAACRAMAVELHYLRLGQQPPPDQPIESLDPSPRALRAFKAAGLHTVNQLRAADPQLLLERTGFPRSAITWAILKLDALGLSHRLVREKKAAPYPKGLDYAELVGPLPPH